MQNTKLNNAKNGLGISPAGSFASNIFHSDFLILN